MSICKKLNDELYKVGPYNSVPVVLHCNCYVLDRVYLTVTIKHSTHTLDSELKLDDGVYWYSMIQ